MREISHVFSAINIVGCVLGILLMVKLYIRDVNFGPEEWHWNTLGFCCIAFCLFGVLREVYSFCHEYPNIIYSAWIFKFVTSGIFIITFFFYKLVKKYKNK